MHPISFALVVDDFRNKYVKHLVNTLQQVGYKLSQEWDGN
jgi:cytochrome c biogenesis factor